MGGGGLSGLEILLRSAELFLEWDLLNYDISIAFDLHQSLHFKCMFLRRSAGVLIATDSLLKIVANKLKS